MPLPNAAVDPVLPQGRPTLADAIVATMARQAWADRRQSALIHIKERNGAQARDNVRLPPEML
jgi:hypothetical protein